MEQGTVTGWEEEEELEGGRAGRAGQGRVG